MSIEHKPLTAVIEELKERHPATETPRTCPHCEDSMESGQYPCCCGHIGARDNAMYVEALERDYHHLRNAIPRLIAMLTPPTDAEVREAVERIIGAQSRVTLDLPQGHKAWITAMYADALILLRAVQAPRLTQEQEEAVKHVDEVLRRNGLKNARGFFRAAFRSVFGKEG